MQPSPRRSQVDHALPTITSKRHEVSGNSTASAPASGARHGSERLPSQEAYLAVPSAAEGGELGSENGRPAINSESRPVAQSIGSSEYGGEAVGRRLLPGVSHVLESGAAVRTIKRSDGGAAAPEALAVPGQRQRFARHARAAGEDAGDGLAAGGRPGAAGGN